MKTKVLNILIILLIGLGAWQAGRIYQTKNGTIDEIREVYKDRWYSDFNLYNEGRVLAIDSVTDHKGNSHSFSDISHNVNLYVFLNSAGCPPCRDMTLRVLDKRLGNNRGAKIVILAKAMPLRDMYVMQKELKDRYEFYRIDGTPFKTIDIADDILSPVLFRTDSNRVVNNCYLVQQDNETGLLEYLTSLNI